MENQVERIKDNQVTTVPPLSVQASKGKGRTKIPNVLYKDFVLLTPGPTVKKLG